MLVVGLLAVAAVFPSLACAPGARRLSYGTLESPAMGRPMEYAIYEPADRGAAERLPLVVFLHGGGDAVDCFDEAGVGQALDAALAQGRLARAVVVVAEGDLGFWENWVDGSRMYRDWVVRDLVPHVRERYATLDCPAGCHVIGISMGGHGALRFALLEPGRFASVTAISAPIMDTDSMLSLANSGFVRFLIPVKRIWGPGDDREEVEQADLFVRWTKPEDLRGMRLVLAWGEADRDRVIDSNERFHAHLERHSVPHEAIVFEGGHDWTAWTPVLEQALSIQIGR
ncbi:MAG: alpha/beta hydrolase [Myxococcota bacterium]